MLSRTVMLSAVLAGLWAIMALFLALTPLAYDDYSYSLVAPSVPDILPAAYKLYMEWNGRFLATSMAHALVLLPAPLYILLTATAFMALLLCLKILVHGSKWAQALTPWNILLTFVLVWSSVPAFGAAFFWRVGTAYYLWTSLAVFACFVPFRLLLSQTRPLPLSGASFAGLALLCFCAGLSIENMGILPLFFAIFVFVVMGRRKISVPRSYYAAAGCILLGFMCLLLAPGNYARLQQESLELPAAVQAGIVAKFFYWCEKMIMGHGYMLVTLSVAAVLLWHCRRSFRRFSLPQYESLLLGCVFFCFALMSSGAMLFSPGYPLRAFTGIALLYILATLCFFETVRVYLPRKKFWCSVMCLAITVSLAYEMQVFVTNHQINRERCEIFSRSKGLDVIVPAYVQADKYFFISSQIKDLQNKGGVNGLIAQYYGLRSVKTPP